MFGPCEVVARALQSEKSTILGALERVNVLENQITTLTSSEVQKLLEKSSDFTEQNVGELKEPTGSGKTKTLLKTRQASASEDFVFDFGVIAANSFLFIDERIEKSH